MSVAIHPDLPVARASAIPHGIDVARVYCGVLLISATGRLLLQLRDDRPGIANPGRITTFGGAAEEGEFEYEAALRELSEELHLRAEPDDLRHLCDVQKAESDGSLTRCSIWLLDGVDVDALRLYEGKAIMQGTLEDFQADQRLTDTCQSILSSYAAYLRYI